MRQNQDAEHEARAIRHLSELASSSNEPLSWFEELYSLANRNDSWIPWSDGNPNPLVVDWIIGRPLGKALVVGCGLGEDAAFLSDRGWDVTAFDISQTAIEWAEEQHTGSNVKWIVADLLNPPVDWQHNFDLVLEVHILQAMPKDLREAASHMLAPFVAPLGSLVCVGRLATDKSEKNGPPWPLETSFVETIGQSIGPMDLHTTQYPNDDDSVIRYRAAWTMNTDSRDLAI